MLGFGSWVFPGDQGSRAPESQPGALRLSHPCAAALGGGCSDFYMLSLYLLRAGDKLARDRNWA